MLAPTSYPIPFQDILRPRNPLRKAPERLLDLNSFQVRSAVFMIRSALETCANAKSRIDGDFTPAESSKSRSTAARGAWTDGDVKPPQSSQLPREESSYLLVKRHSYPGNDLGTTVPMARTASRLSELHKFHSTRYPFIVSNNSSQAKDLNESAFDSKEECSSVPDVQLMASLIKPISESPDCLNLIEDRIEEAVEQDIYRSRKVVEEDSDAKKYFARALDAFDGDYHISSPRSTLSLVATTGSVIYQNDLEDGDMSFEPDALAAYMEQFRSSNQQHLVRADSPAGDPTRPGGVRRDQITQNHVTSSPTHIFVKPGSDLEIDSTALLPFEHIKILGHGASASVEKIRDKNTGEVYARKIFKNVYTRNLEAVKLQFRNEVRIMRRLASHHHIIGVHATYIAQRELALVLSPVANGGDLASFLQEYHDYHHLLPPDEGAKRTLFLYSTFGCLAAGLAFMHQQTVRHKDIKPQNILIHRETVLYTDFGISLDFSEHGRSTTTGYPQSFTRRYCAPEVPGWGRRNSKADVFSLGCVYVEIYAAIYPKHIPDNLLDGPFFEKVNEEGSIFDDHFPGLLGVDAMTKKMLALKASERPSAAQVIQGLPKWLMYFCNRCLEAIKKSGEAFEADVETKTTETSASNSSHSGTTNESFEPRGNKVEAAGQKDLTDSEEEADGGISVVSA